MYSALRLFARFCLLLTIVLLPTACGETHELQFTVHTQKGDATVRCRQIDSLHSQLEMYIGADTLSTWRISHPVFRFDYGNLTGDSMPEIIVGIEKQKSPSHTVREIKLFRIVNEHTIRPFWFNGKTRYRLADFTVNRDTVPALIETLEYGPDSVAMIGQYKKNLLGLKAIQIQKLEDTFTQPFEKKK